MIHLIPSVKVYKKWGGTLEVPAVCYAPETLDPRLVRLLEQLPCAPNGTRVTVETKGDSGEGYTLDLTTHFINIEAEGPAGAFYAVQTLRQIFANGTPVPCLHIEDKPDFPYRGFYHDVTRGRIPTVETIKGLIDQMAYYKLNSLQLYVEHVFDFEQTKDLTPHTGCLTGAELEEIDAYCKENFIDFIPSLSTFGHLYELLEQPQYQHLRVLNDFEKVPNFWDSRMLHHTIDPEQEESIALIRSLIDQYAPHFTSDTFNICCDETFDLTLHKNQEADKGQMYVDFVKKIIDHVKNKDKTVMMWADILLKHPETITQLPEDTVFLNWMYSADPDEEKIKRFAALNRPQIVCPGTTSWSRFIEGIDVEEQNISKMAEYGYKHGALGVLNTNWGDWGNPCSIELALYGLALGAEKSWSTATPVGDAFHQAADTLIYGKDGAFDLVRTVSRLQDKLGRNWNNFIKAYFTYRNGQSPENLPSEEICREIIDGCDGLMKPLRSRWGNDACRRELVLAVKGIRVLAEMTAKMGNYPLDRNGDTSLFLAQYADMWRMKNKESEIEKIIEIFTYLENN